MPIILEHQHCPNAQDWQDLEVIFNENQTLFTTSCQQLKAQLNQTFWLITGRFNQRIVGCVLAQKMPNQQILLSQAGVRQSTQGRGVMHQMIELLSQWADTQQLELKLADVPKHLQQALIKRHFVMSKDTWLRPINPLNKNSKE